MAHREGLNIENTWTGCVLDSRLLVLPEVSGSLPIAGDGQDRPAA